MIAYDQVYTEAQIFLDGGSFYRCKFHRCTILINGLLGCTLVDPQFVGLPMGGIGTGADDV
jgi:hypothetical protein